MHTHTHTHTSSENFGSSITHASLFTGRGGFEAAAESVGIDTIWNCEIDKWLRGKLKKLYPKAKQYTNAKYVKNPITPTILSAGFPCQDISQANPHAKGIKGSKSGLWSEVARVIEECKPPVVILENSSELLKRGFEFVLSDLSRLGYNAEWCCFRACDFGWPHQRRRVYIIAYSSSVRLRQSIFRPLSTITLSRKWTPTEAYLRVSADRAEAFRNPRVIPRHDVVYNYGREIKAYGNAVMPAIAEYLFKCAIQFINQYEILQKINHLQER